MTLRTPRTATRFLAGLTRDRKGATAVEYGLIVALIVLALMAGLVSLGGENRAAWGSILSKIVAATGR